MTSTVAGTKRSIGAGARRPSARSSARTRSSRRCATPSGRTGSRTAPVRRAARDGQDLDGAHPRQGGQLHRPPRRRAVRRLRRLRGHPRGPRARRLELDAASNRGINEVRDLRDRLAYPPRPTSSARSSSSTRSSTSRTAGTSCSSRSRSRPTASSSSSARPSRPASRRPSCRASSASTSGASTVARDRGQARPHPRGRRPDGRPRRRSPSSRAWRPAACATPSRCSTSCSGPRPRRSPRRRYATCSDWPMRPRSTASSTPCAPATSPLGVGILDRLDERGRDPRALLDQVVDAIRGRFVAASTGPERTRARRGRTSARRHRPGSGRHRRLAPPAGAGPVLLGRSSRTGDRLGGCHSDRDPCRRTTWSRLRHAGADRDSDGRPGPRHRSHRSADPAVERSWAPRRSRPHRSREPLRRRRRPHPRPLRKRLSRRPRPRRQRSIRQRQPAMPSRTLPPSRTSRCPPQPPPSPSRLRSDGPSPAPTPSAGPRDLSLDGLSAAWPSVVALLSRQPAVKQLILTCRPVALDGAIVTLGFPEEQGFLRDIAERKRSAIEAGHRRDHRARGQRSVRRRQHRGGPARGRQRPGRRGASDLR